MTLEELVTDLQSIALNSKGMSQEMLVRTPYGIFTVAGIDNESDYYILIEVLDAAAREIVKCVSCEYCYNCRYYKEDVSSNLNGFCELSQEDNGIMEATDYNYPDYPVLCVATHFKCNQWKST